MTFIPVDQEELQAATYAALRAHPISEQAKALVSTLAAMLDDHALATGARKNKRNSTAISMDGKGAWRDNVFVERLWKSVKYEEVYLRAYETVAEARISIGRYLDFYNGRRPHSSLDDRTPDQAYFDLPPLRAAA
jgi:transposase InsO family protein